MQRRFPDLGLFVRHQIARSLENDVDTGRFNYFQSQIFERSLLKETQMSFLNRFFDDTFENPSSPRNSQLESADLGNSFETLSAAELSAHLDIDRYGEFELTDAIRPAADLKIKPSQGYRHDVYVDEESGNRVPVIMAAATRTTLFGTFLNLIQRLGPVVDVVLETSHDRDAGEHVDLYREHIDMPVLLSVLWEYEDLLTNDGCTGIAVLNPNTPQEVQFDEHKLLILYGSPLEPFEHTLEINGIECRKDLCFITEAEHVHASNDDFTRRFQLLRTDLGLDGSQSQAQSHDEEGFV